LNTTLGQRALSRVRWCLLPFLGLLYVVSYLDRVNVRFAKDDERIDRDR
jgi:hypothetical protein